MIPSSIDSWKEGVIGDVVTLQRGHDLPKDKMRQGSYPVAGSTETIGFHNSYTCEPPCIILGRSGNIGKPRLYLERCWAHNTALYSKEFKESNPYWVYAMLQTIDFKQFQGGSAVPTLNRNHVHGFPVTIPPKSVQDEFGMIASSFVNRVHLNEVENGRLVSIRDSLLPRLMSGEIDVSNVTI